MEENNTDKLFHLQQELEPYRKVLGEAADAIIDQGVSEYPIFVVHQQEVDIGLPLVTGEAKGKLRWSVNATTLEEMTTKQIIQPEKVDSFREVYKDPQEHLCLFVLSELGANFIFMPRKDG